jgi:hypothetical protein
MSSIVHDTIGLRRVAAPLAAPVLAAHRRHQRRQLLGLFRIGRRRDHQRHLEQVQLTSLIGRNLDLVEAHGFFRKSRRRIGERLRGAGVHRLGIRRDEVLADPSGTIRIEREPRKRAVHFVQELLRIRSSRRRRRGGARCAENETRTDDDGR